MFAIRLTINNPEGELKNLEEFLILDNSENSDVWEEYGTMIMKHIEDNIISDAKRETFDVETQTYSLTFYSNTKAKAEEFLEHYNAQSYYVQGMENLKNKGWTAVETIEEADRYAAMGAHKISVDWYQLDNKIKYLSNN
jgi:hypothetical protein